MLQASGLNPWKTTNQLQTEPTPQFGDNGKDIDDYDNDNYDWNDARGDEDGDKDEESTCKLRRLHLRQPRYYFQQNKYVLGLLVTEYVLFITYNLISVL